MWKSICRVSSKLLVRKNGTYIREVFDFNGSYRLEYVGQPSIEERLRALDVYPDSIEEHAKVFTGVQNQDDFKAYDIGAQILTEFFHKQIEKFLQPGLDDLGQKIIECCLSGGSVEDYEKLIVTKNN